MLCYAASDLVWHCLLMSHKMDARLIWVNAERFWLSSGQLQIKYTLSRLQDQSDLGSLCLLRPKTEMPTSLLFVESYPFSRLISAL